MEKKTYVTKEEAKVLTGSKHDMYQAMLANHFYLPNETAACVTIDYMQKVRKGTFWVPKYEEVRLLPCPYPPLKEVIFKEIVDKTKTKGLDLGIKGAHAVDGAWLLVILSTVDP